MYPLVVFEAVHELPRDRRAGRILVGDVAQAMRACVELDGHRGGAAALVQNQAPGGGEMNHPELALITLLCSIAASHLQIGCRLLEVLTVGHDSRDATLVGGVALQRPEGVHKPNLLGAREPAGAGAHRPVAAELPEQYIHRHTGHVNREVLLQRQGARREEIRVACTSDAEQTQHRQHVAQNI